jgi:myotubularin-related protein 1/2
LKGSFEANLCKANALGNQVTGAGWEKDYENCIVQFMNIENIHEMRNSWTKLSNIIKDYNPEDEVSSWLLNVDSTQ